MQASRQFDVIVYGATGFTGQLVAEYLMQRYGCGSTLEWAIAGRNPDKLEAVKKRLGDDAAGLEIIVADSSDDNALASLAARPVARPAFPLETLGRRGNEDEG